MLVRPLHVHRGPPLPLHARRGPPLPLRSAAVDGACQSSLTVSFPRQPIHLALPLPLLPCFYSIQFGGGGIFGACKNIDISEINGYVTVSLADVAAGLSLRFATSAEVEQMPYQANGVRPALLPSDRSTPLHSHGAGAG